MQHDGRAARASPPAILICGVVTGITIVAVAAQTLGGECHTLRMVAGRRGDDARVELRPGELRHLVVGAPQLERKHPAAGPLALQQQPCCAAAADSVAASSQRRLHRRRRRPWRSGSSGAGSRSARVAGTVFGRSRPEGRGESEQQASGREPRQAADHASWTDAPHCAAMPATGTPRVCVSRARPERDRPRARRASPRHWARRRGCARPVTAAGASSRASPARLYAGALGISMLDRQRLPGPASARATPRKAAARSSSAPCRRASRCCRPRSARTARRGCCACRERSSRARRQRVDHR